MSEIDELKANREAHEKAIREIDQRITALRLEAAMARTGVFKGCVVEYKGNIYKVVEIDVSAEWRLSKPWVVGVPRRKDGTFGTARRNLFDDWTVVQEALPKPEGDKSSITLYEIANRVLEHLVRFEKEPNGHRKYYHPNAWKAGSKLGIKYISFQCDHFLTKDEALAYLAWLDAGNEGKHHAVEQ